MEELGQAEERGQAEPPSSSADHDAHRLRNGVIWTVVLLLMLLGIGLAVPDLRDVIKRATHANLLWLALGVGLELISCLGYVAVVRLVLHRGPPKEVRQLAWAEMAFGAVVPVGGAGGLAVGAWAMRTWGVAWTRIANRSAVIFLLTSTVNAVVLVIAGLALVAHVGHHHLSIVYGLVPALGTVLIIAFFLVVPALPKPRRSTRLRAAFEHATSWVQDTEAAAFHWNWRLLGAVSYLLADIAVLWVCLRAVGITAPVFALIAGYQIGYLANVVPIPGGVGVLEGGLVGALVLYGFPAGPTAAAVILYHAIALWVPTVGGTFEFARLRKTLATGVIPPEVLAARQQDDVAA
ncbi:MAG TPA: lysylphosphatidylglycerol synthase transmembrane domain-containing protein [Solirubrobacteraceae bacterium]|nr:lysylphosphatidylglycerol synthase transmembrane domain-containing protein [Solirubrobacteraceae bacterium]